MAIRRRVFSSSVGTKLLIGATGLALFLYLITHIAGNLVVLAGRDTFNNYSHMLLSNPLIPVIEIGLVLIVLLHIYKTVTMYLANQKARPVKYRQKKPAREAWPADDPIFKPRSPAARLASGTPPKS